MTSNIEILFVLDYISQSQDLFLRVCEQWLFALVSNLGCGCGWSGGGYKKQQKTYHIVQKIKLAYYNI